MRLTKFFAIVAAAFLLTSCARDLSSNVYTSDSTLSLTLEGKVVSVRDIVIKEQDRLGNYGKGTLAGGALGAAAGSQVGGGRGAVAGVIGGAVVGAMVGQGAEAALSKSKGYEYIVKVDASGIKNNYYEGTPAMRKVISAATTSGLITVVQGTDVKIAKGTKVFVIFSDERTLITPAE